MADVYATFADGGWRNSPIAITKVVFPDGHADTNWGKPHRVKVLTEAVAGEETSILHQNVLGGTATKSAINCPTAAKTGTTNEPDRRLARRLQLRILDGRLDGLPEQARRNDRRPRAAAAGRLPAGRHLARLHGAGDRRPPLRRAARIERRHQLRALLRQIRRHRPDRGRIRKRTAGRTRAAAHTSRALRAQRRPTDRAHRANPRSAAPAATAPGAPTATPVPRRRPTAPDGRRRDRAERRDRARHGPRTPRW